MRRLARATTVTFLLGFGVASGAEPQARPAQQEIRESAEATDRQRPELKRRASPDRGREANGACPDEISAVACARQERKGDRVIRDRRAFERAHAEFHRRHERECRDRADQRPRDVHWQVRVRAECRAEHDRWHAVHDPDWRG